MKNQYGESSDAVFEVRASEDVKAPDGTAHLERRENGGSSWY